MRALLGLILIALIPQMALASDWRYCLAPSHGEHRIYVTAPFPANIAMSDAESEFARALTASGLRYDDVQCPRSDGESGLLNMQQHAMSLNQELGNRIINLRWRPGG
jgi:hypothetical protein